MTNPPQRQPYQYTPSASDVAKYRQDIVDTSLRVIGLWGYDRIDGFSNLNGVAGQRIFGVDFGGLVGIQAGQSKDFIAEQELFLLLRELLEELKMDISSLVIRFNDIDLSNFISQQYLGLDGAQIVRLQQALAHKRYISPSDLTSEIVGIFGSRQGEVAKLANLLNIVNPHDLPKDILKSDLSERAIHVGDLLAGELDYVTRFDPTYIQKKSVQNSGLIFEITDQNSNVLITGRTDGGNLRAYLNPDSLIDHLKVPEATPDVDLIIIESGNIKRRDIYDLARKFRDENVPVLVDISGDSYENQLKNAVRKKVKYILIFEKNSAKDEVYRLISSEGHFDEKMGYARIVSIVQDVRKKQQFDEDSLFEF